MTYIYKDTGINASGIKEHYNGIIQSRKLQLLEQWEKLLGNQPEYRKILNINSESDGGYIIDNNSPDLINVEYFKHERIDNNIINNYISNPDKCEINAKLLLNETQYKNEQYTKIIHLANEKIIDQSSKITKNNNEENIYRRNVYSNNNNIQASFMQIHDGILGLSVYMRDYRLSHKDFNALVKNFNALSASNMVTIASIKLNGISVTDSHLNEQFDIYNDNDLIVNYLL